MTALNDALHLIQDLRCYAASLIERHETAKTWRLPDSSWVTYDMPMTAEEVADDMGFEPSDVEPINPQGDMQ